MGNREQGQGQAEWEQGLYSPGYADKALLRGNFGAMHRFLSPEVICSDFDLITIIVVEARIEQIPGCRDTSQEARWKGMDAPGCCQKLKLISCSLYCAHISGPEKSGCKHPMTSGGIPSHGLSSFM